jgi:voltage-gated potassium channel
MLCDGPAVTATGHPRPKETSMTEQARAERVQHSNAYNIFILVLTILSLAIMALLILPLPEQVLQVLWVYDNLICVVFLGDFALNMSRTKPRREYFINQRGWLDLLGSIPSLNILRITALLRLARLSRLARITRLLRGENKKRLIADVVENRGQYAVFITLLSAMIVLVVSSVLVLEFESRAPAGEANIVTGGDALWWAFVTITTVGYGDYFPVTALGRVTGVAVMFAGVGIIGALASILASILVPDAPAAAGAGAVLPTVDLTPDEAAASGLEPASTPVAAASATPISASVEAELASLRAEIEALRRSLAVDPGRSAG